MNIGQLVEQTATQLAEVIRGGPGSGHFEHEGRPGEVGGSKPGKGGGKITIPKDFQEMADLYDLVPQEGETNKTRADYFDRIMGNAFEIAFEEAEALGDEIGTMPWPEFSGMNWEFKKYDPRREDYPDLSDEQFSLLDDAFVFGVEHVRQQVHDWAIKRMIARGVLDPAGARDITSTDAYRPQGREWQPLPEVLYHVTTAAEAVREEGLKSRLELRMWAGRGLGGGESDTISFTADLETAREIDRALHEGRLVARGELTIEDMVRLAAEGKNADRPFLGDVYEMRSGRGFRAMTAEEVNEAVADDPTNIPEPIKKWLNHQLDKEQESDVGKEAWEFYNYGFARMRQYAGGPAYPLFFGTDYEALAESDPADFSILEFRPTEGAMGYAMGVALGEWRTVGGETVELVAEYEEIIPETEEELIGP